MKWAFKATCKNTQSGDVLRAMLWVWQYPGLV